MTGKFLKALNFNTIVILEHTISLLKLNLGEGMKCFYYFQIYLLHDNVRPQCDENTESALKVNERLNVILKDHLDFELTLELHTFH